jgi:hypothetical protein
MIRWKTRTGVMRSLFNKKAAQRGAAADAFSPSLRWHYPDQVQRVGG